MVFFFFKQKTAYEMRISDWSSDVCSSDLQRPLARGIEEALSREFFPAVLQQIQQRALTGQLQRLDDDLVLGAAGIAGEAAGGDHLHAVLGRYAEAPRVAAPAYRVAHRPALLHRPVATARDGALDAGDPPPPAPP